MLQTKYTATGWLLVLIVFITSCTSSTPEQTKYIPKDASVVFSINPKKLQDKLSDSKVSLDSIMRSALGSDTSMMITADDIANSGIDLRKDVFVFVNYSGSMMTGSTITTGVVAVMHKASDFEAFLKKKMPSVQIQKDKDYSYAMLKDRSVAGWTDDIIIIDNVTGYNTQTGGQTGTGEAAHQQLTTLFTQKEDASLASIKQFKDANDGKADMFFWSNSNSTLSSIPMIGMSKASDLFKDTYSAGAINFENGKVDMDIKSYPNQTLSDTMKKYAGPKVDMDLLNKYPGAVNGFALFSFDPKLIVAILNFMGVTQTANQFMQNQGFGVEDIVKAFKGDFAVIFSNAGAKPMGSDAGSTFTAKIVVDAAIGDKASYDRIVTALAKNGLMVQKGGQYVPQFMAENPMGFSMYTDAKNIVVASDSGLLKQYVAGTGKIALPSDIAGKAKGTAAAIYVDMNSILNAIPAEPATTDINAIAKQTFKDVIFTTDNYSGGNVTGHAELRTMNEKENSLAALTRYFGSLSETIKKMKDATGTDGTMPAMPDTSITPESMDTTSK